MEMNVRKSPSVEKILSKDQQKNLSKLDISPKNVQEMDTKNKEPNTASNIDNSRSISRLGLSKDYQQKQFESNKNTQNQSFNNTKTRHREHDREYSKPWRNRLSCHSNSKKTRRLHRRRLL